MLLPTVAIVLPVIERTEPVNVRTGGKSTRAMMKIMDQVFMMKVLMSGEDYRKGSYTSRCVIISSKDVTVVERFGNELGLSVNCTNKLSYIPGKILLENTFTSNTKFSAKCIES